MRTFPVDAELNALLKSGRVATDEELEEQRISFAYGNAPPSELITKETVRAAARSIRMR